MAPRFAYRLSLDPALSAFQPEIEYVCTLLGEAHGLIRDAGATRILHYGPNPPEGDAAVVPSHLFDAVSVGEDGLHLAPDTLDRLAPRLLPRTDARDFDAIGLIFLLVSRLEERDAPSDDRYGRYAFASDFQQRHGLFGRAPVDEALAALARLVTGEAAPVNATSYTLQLTHDVDRLKGYHRAVDPLRYALGDLLKRRKPVRALQQLAGYFSLEPWPSFTDIMDLSERHGVASRFYFMGPSRHRHDSPYAATMPKLTQAVAGLVRRRGHRFGFHPGHATCRDPALWQQQRAGLETILGQPVVEGRQHMLGYNAAETPDIWDRAGMLADYTPAYPEAEGFRTGSSRVFPAYSLTRRQPLRLRQGSTAIMDFGLFGGKYRDLTVDEALQSCRPIIAAARQFGGTLTVLFHTGQPTGPARIFYEALLKEAA
jgi:hypothetical protein